MSEPHLPREVRHRLAIIHHDGVRLRILEVLPISLTRRTGTPASGPTNDGPRVAAVHRPARGGGSLSILFTATSSD